jgi:CheY-like chemotaxis protein
MKITHKILLVDDTKLIIEIAKSFLANSPVRVLTASNGEEALEIIGREKPDLVVLDRNMPIMNGIDCCAAIRRNPAIPKMPVIMMSGCFNKEEWEAFRHVGGDSFLPKPLQRQSFLNMLRKFMPAIERRETRVTCHTVVSFVLKGKEFTSVSEDISANGIYIATDIPAAIEDKVSLSFNLPGREGEPGIVASGRIAWINSVPGSTNPNRSPGFGVEILLITGEGLAMLRRKELTQFVAALS